MADETTLSTVERQPEGVPPVLDEAHIGDIRGALGTIRMLLGQASTGSGSIGRFRRT